MGLSESRLESHTNPETPQYMKYLENDPRSPGYGYGRTPVATAHSRCGNTTLRDPRSPTNQFARTPLFEIPEPFDFDKFYGVEAESPNVIKFENEGYEQTPMKPEAEDDVTKVQAVEAQHHLSSKDGEENICVDGKKEKLTNKGRSRKIEENSNRRRKSLSKTSEKDTASETVNLTRSKSKSKRRRSRLLKENKTFGTKKLEFNENYMSPSNRSPLATRNFVPLRESPAVKDSKSKTESLLLNSKFRVREPQNDSFSEKENLIPFPHLTYV